MMRTFLNTYTEQTIILTLSNLELKDSNTIGDTCFLITYNSEFIVENLQIENSPLLFSMFKLVESEFHIDNL